MCYVAIRYISNFPKVHFLVSTVIICGFSRGQFAVSFRPDFSSHFCVFYFNNLSHGSLFSLSLFLSNDHVPRINRVTPVLCRYFLSPRWLSSEHQRMLQRREGPFSSRREYKNMYLSLQSLWLRRDLHEKTKTCFRGVSSPFPRAFAAPVAFSPFALTQPRGAVPHRTAVRYSVQTRRGEKLAQRDSLAPVLCILQ